MDFLTDVAGLDILIVIVLYSYIFCAHHCLVKLSEKIREQNLYICIKENYLLSNDCIDIGTDGAKIMTGKRVEAVSRINSEAPTIVSSIDRHLRLGKRRQI